jgi:deazaflavin-dependent oxidoreductase (nitroreductase family)
MSDMNDQIISEFRSNSGVVGGHFEGKHLLILHTLGRKTGQARLNPLVYATDGDNFLICGSMGGAPKDPDWVANAAAMSEVTIEVGGDKLQATPKLVAPTEADWERVYGLWAAYWPDATEYEKNTTRKFPIIVLEPVVA